LLAPLIHRLRATFQLVQAGKQAGRVLLVSSDADLTEELLRLSAAAGVTPETVSDPAVARRSWRQAAGVLVGADAVQSVVAARLPRRDGVVLVSPATATPMLWQQGLALHAESVTELPAGAAELVGRLSDFLDGAHTECLTVGVAAACGGGGASTVAAALAVTAARSGVPTVLVDADSMAGGIDLVLGCEDVEGLRWSDVAVTSGRVSATALREALPRCDQLGVLSWDRSTECVLDAATVKSILSAAQRGSQLVLVDLPRRLDDAAAEAAACCDVLLLVCSTDVRALAGAVRVVEVLRHLTADIRLVVRLGIGAPAAGDAMSDLLRLPLLGSVPTRRKIVRSIDDGLGIPTRGPLIASCRRMLRDLGVGGQS
jgi:secretion/DNA translocation related CpaE-like protein